MLTGTDGDRGRALQDVVRRSQLPVALVDLVDLRVVTASPSAAATVGQADLQGLDLLLLLAESESAKSALGLLRSGTVDGYEAHRVFVGTGGEERAITVWMRGLANRGFAEWALAHVRATEDGAEPRGGSPDLAAHPLPIAAGTADLDGGVDFLTSEIETLLGVPSSSFRAEPLLSWVHPADVGRLASALKRSQDSGSPEVVAARLRTGEQDWALVRIVVKVGAATNGSRLGVAILGDHAGDPGRASDPSVEGLAGEIRAIDLADAMTYLPARTAVPELDELTEREWEIVARLLRGDRVPAIAGALFLAPSTVRNHLVSVFRKVGVNSQQELISFFRGSRNK